MVPPSTEHVFLATTALEEFWDTTLPIVFLGPWCTRFTKAHVWHSLRHCMIESPWNDSGARVAALDDCNRAYEETLSSLGCALNHVHDCAHSIRYWRILLGPWLQYYIAATYDRFTCIQAALDKFPNLTTIRLSSDAYEVPVDTIEFDEWMKTDVYNLQLYSQILEFVGKQFPGKSRRVRQGAPAKSYAFSVSRMASRLLNLVGTVAPVDKSILLHRSYFPWRAELQLLTRTHGAVRRIVPYEKRPAPVPLQNDMREEIRGALPASGGFLSYLRWSVPQALPQCFAESYGSMRNFVNANFPAAPKAIFTANAEYYDEPFKFWAAAAVDDGSMLLGTVHGTRYGAASWMRAEEHELAVFDRYYSWGWERKGKPAVVVPMPAPKLIANTKVKASNAKTGILLCGTTAPRYLREFPFSPQQFDEYLNWQARFLNCVDVNIRKQLRFRPHREDQGWDIVQRATSHIPELQIEGWDIPFLRSLDSCRLYVCDHCSTTFGEALAINKPTILFWNYEGNELREGAQPFFEELRKGEILYYDPEEAAAAVNRVYSDVQTWWSDPGRQRIRQRFCHRFARTSPRAILEWAAEFERMQRMLPTPLAPRSQTHSAGAKSTAC